VTFAKNHPGVHLHPACGHLLPEGEGIKRKVGRAVPSAPGSSRTAEDSRPYLSLGQVTSPEGAACNSPGRQPRVGWPKKTQASKVRHKPTITAVKNMDRQDGQGFEELKTENLKLKTSKKSGAENRTPRRSRECRDTLSQRERAGERENA